MTMREIILQVLTARAVPDADALATELAAALEAANFAQWTGIGGRFEYMESYGGL
ncbi:MAG TPA: hypothetical protein VKQ11_00710 [Candidatus Sulfotelmatobacter sp.]|nr:hypothetical protein [Candidatus Sulfotelmatobacter sp.]